MKLMIKFFLGFLLATVLICLANAGMSFIEMLTGFSICKAWLGSGLCGIMSILCYIICISFMIKSK